MGSRDTVADLYELAEHFGVYERLQVELVLASIYLELTGEFLMPEVMGAYEVADETLQFEVGCQRVTLFFPSTVEEACHEVLKGACIA